MSLPRGALVLPLAAALLTGCLSIGGEKAELAVYAPVVSLQADPAWPRLPLTLAIDEPEASTALDSNRIAVRPTPGRLQVYAGALWSDSAPVLVQSALVDAFDQTGRFRAVGRPTGDVASDLLLQLELRQFEAVYADDARRPTVTVALQATLVDRRQLRVLASRVVRIERPMEREKLRDVVPGFEAALADAARELLPWVLAEGRGAVTPAGRGRTCRHVR